MGVFFFKTNFLILERMSLSRGFRGFVPFANRVLVRRAEAAKTSAGGIMLPETSQKKLNIAEVIAHGEGYTGEDGKVISLSVALGDKVLLPEFGGTEIELEGEKFQLYRDLDFLGKMD